MTLIERLQHSTEDTDITFWLACLLALIALEMQLSGIWQNIKWGITGAKGVGKWLHKKRIKREDALVKRVEDRLASKGGVAQPHLVAFPGGPSSPLRDQNMDEVLKCSGCGMLNTRKLWNVMLRDGEHHRAPITGKVCLGGTLMLTVKQE